MIQNTMNPLRVMDYIENNYKPIKQICNLNSKIMADFFGVIKKSQDFLSEYFPSMLITREITETLENAAKVSAQATRITKEPELPIDSKVVWENDLVTVKEVEQSGDIPDRVFMLYLPIMRGPFLAFYTEYDKPDRLKSVGKALMSANAGRILFTEWNPLTKKTLNTEFNEYLQTMHDISGVIKEKYGKTPHDINFCQPGYMDILRLAKYPDDVLSTTLIASPHKGKDPDSILYDVLHKYSPELVMEIIKQSGDRIYGKDIANYWGMANHNLMINKYMTEPIDMMVQIFKGTFNAMRANTHNDFMYEDVRDIPLPTFETIYSLFYDDMMLNPAPLGYDQSNYKNPILTVIGKNDDIVTIDMANTVHDYVGTHEKDKFCEVVPGGHSGVFNGYKSINDHWVPNIIPKLLDIDKKMKTIVKYEH